jgi:KDO2-lipid IV(A) lauroyltransferase
MWRAAAWFIGRLPWRWLAVFGALAGEIAGSLLRIRRVHVESAMGAAGIMGPPREARAMYRALGCSAMEFLWLAGRGGEAADHVAIEAASQPLWRGALARGRGVVIAASHTGNWDLAACAMARQVELLVVTKRLRDGALDTFWQETRQRQGVSLTSASGALSRSLRALARGGAVAMMIDQVPEATHHAIDVEFLGASASTDRAPAALAARAGAPLVVAVSRRDANGEHVLQVLAVLVPPARPERAWIDAATTAAAHALDGFVRAHPSQWLWLHRRWKRPPCRGDWGARQSGATLVVSCTPPSKTKTPSSSQAAASKAV